MRYMRKLHPYLDILVSSIGEVFVPQNGTHKAKWTFGTKNSLGYRQVTIDYKIYYVHRLVAETFLQYPIPKGYEVDHIDRDKSANMVSNLRIVSKSGNQRNTPANDRVDARGGTHWYADKKQYQRENQARYCAKSKDKLRERDARFYQAKRKTHKVVKFADGSKHWLSIPDAEAYLIIPLKERNYYAK